MKRINNLFKLMIALFVIIAASVKTYADLPDLGPIVNPSVVIDGIKYALDTNEGVAFLSNGQNAAGDVVIPSTIKRGGKECKVIEVCSSSFAGNIYISSVVIPNTVKKINSNAFNGCKTLASITIPNSVTEIGHGAFEYCERLKSINLPNSLTEIQFNTFYDCISLKTITIPASVEKINETAFNFCKNLADVQFLNENTKVHEEAFLNCPKVNPIGWNGKTFHTRKLYKIFMVNGVKKVYEANDVKFYFGSEEKAAQYYVSEFEK